jgi:dolichyl-phosphate-mannose--protein O-mannosyl transferase
MWLVKESFKASVCEAGKPIACGQHIRLEHAQTGKNLHSHLFKAPLSGNQEVSAFGENGLPRLYFLVVDFPHS